MASSATCQSSRLSRRCCCAVVVLLLWALLLCCCCCCDRPSPAQLRNHRETLLNVLSTMLLLLCFLKQAPHIFTPRIFKNLDGPHFAINILPLKIAYKKHPLLRGDQPPPSRNLHVQKIVGWNCACAFGICLCCWSTTRVVFKAVPAPYRLYRLYRRCTGCTGAVPVVPAVPALYQLYRYVDGEVVNSFKHIITKL